MKILFLSGDVILENKKTGIGNYYINLIKGIHKFKGIIGNGETIDYDIAVFNSDISIDRYKDEIKNHIKFIKKPFNKRTKYFLPIELLFGRYDVYVCDGWIPLTFFKSKKISLIFDLMSIVYPENYNKITQIYLNRYFKMSLKSDKVIAISKSTKRDLINYYGIKSNQVNIVYPIIKFDKNITYNSSKNIDYTKKYLFYIGDMRKNKNLLMMIKGFKLYLDRNPNDSLFFYIAGRKQAEYNILNKYVNQYNLQNRVIFLDYVSDEERLLLYKYAYTFLYAVIYEGFGIPIIEAMSMKVPVITSNTSSMKEIGKNKNEDICILVNPKSTHDICNAIERVNNINVRKKLIENGLNRSKDFSESKGVKSFINVLKEL